MFFIFVIFVVEGFVKFLSITTMKIESGQRTENFILVYLFIYIIYTEIINLNSDLNSEFEFKD